MELKPGENNSISYPHYTVTFMARHTTLSQPLGEFSQFYMIPIVPFISRIRSDWYG